MNGALVSWTERVGRLPVHIRALLVVTALALAMSVDRASGPDLEMSFAYALCVIGAAWILSLRWAVVVAVLALAAGVVVDSAGEHEGTWAVFVTNHALRALSFVVLVVLTSYVRRTFEELLHSSRRDAMTGLMTRSRFHELLDAARHRAQRHATPIGVVYLDLDGLKRVNDTEGHAAGDALIRRFVERVQRHLRASDAFGRLGGDEFAIALERADAAVIDAVVGRILDDPGLPDVSCGVQIFERGYPSAAEMLAGADREMYHDKRARRGPVTR